MRDVGPLENETSASVTLLVVSRSLNLSWSGAPNDVYSAWTTKYIS